MEVIFILFHFLLIPSLVLYGTYTQTSNTDVKEVMTASDLSISENPVTLVSSAKVNIDTVKEACNKIKEAQTKSEEVQVEDKTEEPKKPSVFDKNGLLVMKSSKRANQIASMLLAVHSGGAVYHKTSGLDSLIDQLSDAECFYVLHKIEGKGFGQTVSGYAGVDSPASHKSLIQNQVNKRFGGKIQNLLKKWGTYSYGGY